MSARLVVGLFMLISGGMGCGGGRDGEEAGQVEEASRAVRVMRPGVEDLRWSLDYVGTVEFERQVQVMSRVGGTVVEVLVEEGERVEGGELVVRLESGEIVARREGLGAEVKRVEGEWVFHCESAERQERLVEAGAGTRVSAESARAQCEALEQGLQAARAGLLEVEERVGYLRERAPFSGVIVKKMVEEGEHVVPGRPLFLVGSEELEVHVLVSQGDMERGVEVGMGVELRGGQEVVRGVVKRISARGQGLGRMSRVIVAFEAGDKGRWRVGGSADVSFVLQERVGAVVVGAESLVEDEEGASVFVVKDGRLEQVGVEVGERQGWRVEIVSPLSADALVVVGGVEGLEEGQRVYAVEVGGER